MFVKYEIEIREQKLGFFLFWRRKNPAGKFL